MSTESTPVADYRPNMLLKGLAILLLYVLLGHPSVYAAVWQQGNWYVIILGAIAVPTLLPWCIQVLVWRVRIDASTVEIRSLRGVLKANLKDLAQIDRAPGKVVIAFKDGSKRTIPSTVSNLDIIANDIRLRRDRCLQ